MMEGSFLSKRTFDSSSTSTTDRRENGNKRRHNHHHHHHHHPPTPNSSSSSSSMNFKPPPPPLKLSAGETLFRILCPAIKTGGVIGKGGAIIRQFREETGAKIRIDEAFPGCDERVIFIVAETLRGGRRNGDGGENDEEDLGGGGGGGGEEEEVSSPAQHALLRVFDRILKVDEERLRVSGENEDGLEERDHRTDNTSTSTSNSVMGGAATTMNQGSVVCRLLAPSHQVGCVLGRGGKIVEKIRQASGAQIRILPKEHIPPCAFAGDELIQITGNQSAVKKALLSVSSCLQDNSRPDATNSAVPKPLGSSLRGSGMPVQVDQFLSRGHSTGNHALDYHSRNYSSIPGSESIGASHRKVPEEEVVFRLLCHLDKVGSLIGKGGAIIRALQSDTCASIKIADAAPDSDERVVLISAREDKVVEIYVTRNMDHACCGVLNAKMSLEQSHSPAQDAVIRVQSRIAEIGFEPGAAVVARLLVPSQQIGCLLGKGGNVITEMRRATGASIRIFAKEQVPKCGAQNDEVVQVIGSLQSVQDALFHITGRLRESLFPMKPPFNGIGPPPYMCGPPESPIPLFRPRYDPASPGHYPSSNGFSTEHTGPPHPMDRQPVHLHGMDHVNRGPYPYGSERSGHGPIFDPHSSPRSWTPQSGSNGNLRCGAEVGTCLASRNGLIGSGSQMAVTTSVEVVVPLEFWGSICGEDNNLSHVRQISGANVVVHDLRPGSTEGVVFVSGTSDQIDAAQSLIQAFILSGQATP